MDLGIIGGADGPTVFFFTGDPAGLILMLLLLAVAIGGLIWFFRHKRKK